MLIAKLTQSMNDLIAFGAQYHLECLITIYKQASHVQTSAVQGITTTRLRTFHL